MILSDDDHIRLTVAVLNLAAERFGSHVCNDFDLREVDGFEHPVKQCELDRLYHEDNGDPDEHEPDQDHHMASDFCVMGYLASWWAKRVGPASEATEEQKRAIDEAETARAVRQAEAEVSYRKREATKAASELRKAEAKLAAARGT